MPDLGRKLDVGKDRYDLVPEVAEELFVKVLTFGASKYAPQNWRLVPDWAPRYFAALRRHLAAWRRGERLDPETGLPHLAHAMCCVAFLLELDEVEQMLYSGRDRQDEARLPGEERGREELVVGRPDEGRGREAASAGRGVQAHRQVGKGESRQEMNPDTGAIERKPKAMSDEDWAEHCRERGLVPIEAKDLPALKGMNRKQRRAWLSKQRRGKA
jgi:hypothetical protein